MSKATLTLMGLLNYDNGLLNTNFNFPISFSDKLKTSVINNVVFECAELEVIYANPEWFGRALNAWSTVMIPEWDYFYKWQIEMDKATIENSGGNKTTTKDSTRTPKLTNSTTSSGNSSSDDSTQRSTSAYNQSSYYPAEQIISSNETITDGTSSTQYTGTENYKETIVEDNGIDLTELVDLSEQGYLNIVDRICSAFKERFCLMIY